MRTGTNNIIDDDPAESEFRRILRIYGEPTNPPAPPDLVVRSARHIPDQLPATLLRQQQFVFALRWAIMLALVALAAFGALIIFNGGPAATLFGTGQAGISRSLLTLQLLLKPIRALLTIIGLPTLIIGIAAGISSLYILNRHLTAPRDLRVGT
jgi:hypothetical protein